MDRIAILSGACALLALMTGAPATAQSVPVTGPLVTLAEAEGSSFNRLERLSAIANQATYNRLTMSSAGYTAPCDADQQAPSATCTPELFRVLRNTRELVHTAYELLGTGSGPTQYSLGVDEEGLGFALRWTAAEELSAIGSVNSEFANTQMASMVNRINALRFGAGGFSLAGVPVAFGADGRLARALPPARGGGASADEEPSIATNWGGFLNGSFGWGDRQPTDVEDAFAFDGKDLSLGIDYRFGRQFVLGAIAGYMKQRVDFDSTRSVVDGGIESDGFSFTLFALQEWAGPYVSASIAWSLLDVDSTRVINYPSLNVNTESSYATAYGSTTSTTWSASFNFGWPLYSKAFAIEPYLRGDYSTTRIDAFKEYSVDHLNGGQPAGYDFAFAKQTLGTFDTALGFRAQYVFTPSFGVIVPYLTAEAHHNFEDGTDSIRASYNGAAQGSDLFELPGDKPDTDFFTIAAGASVVLPHGIQGFVQYRTVAGLRNVSNQSITIGVRGEF